MSLPIIQLIRPRQWIKNFFVFAPLIFSAEFVNYSSVLSSLWAFFLFCIAASASYVLNDFRDVERDRLHPTKRYKRPLAAGTVSLTQAKLLLVILYGILLASLLITPKISLVIMVYIALNVAYSLKLKEEPVVDIFIIAIGFVLRVYAGAVAIEVPVSAWMFVTTLCLALYLAAIKRRQELHLSGNSARKILEHYTVSLMERYAEMAATGALVFYSMFVITTHPAMVITIPFVLFGLYRYWFIVESMDGGESPTDVVLTDLQLGLTVVAWGIAVLYVLWPK